MTDEFSIDEVIADVKVGKPVIIVDDPAREDEGDVFVAAAKITEDRIAFIRMRATGKICVPMEAERLDKLGLDLMVPESYQYERWCRFTITVDSRNGRRDHGMSDYDRVFTIRKLIDEQLGPNYFVSPGHVEPLRAERGGVFVRQGHTEAAVDLARVARLYPAGVICEVINPNGTMARGDNLGAFARKYDLKLISIEQIRKHVYRIS